MTASQRWLIRSAGEFWPSHFVSTCRCTSSSGTVSCRRLVTLGPAAAWACARGEGEQRGQDSLFMTTGLLARLKESAPLICPSDRTGVTRSVVRCSHRHAIQFCPLRVVRGSSRIIRVGASVRTGRHQHVTRGFGVASGQVSRGAVGRCEARRCPTPSGSANCHRSPKATSYAFGSFLSSCLARLFQRPCLRAIDAGLPLMSCRTDCR